MPVEPARPGTAQPDSVQPGLVEPDGGDPVCWSHLLCPRCGAMPEPATPDDDERGWASCWRCGFRTGTGSSSGAAFLRLALELTFFPELYAVRTALWYRPVISPGPARTHAIEAQTSACHDHGRRAGSVRMLLGIEVGPERLALR